MAHSEFGEAQKGAILVVFPIVRLARPKTGVILIVFPLVRLARP